MGVGSVIGWLFGTGAGTTATAADTAQDVVEVVEDVQEAADLFEVDEETGTTPIGDAVSDGAQTLAEAAVVAAVLLALGGFAGGLLFGVIV